MKKTFLWLVTLLAVLGACVPQTNSGTAVPSPQVNAPTPTGSPNAPRVVDARLNEDFVLHLRETAILTDTPDRFGISLYAIKQDSRCPQGVTCVWAGEVRADITFQENRVLHPPVFEMTTSPGDPKHRMEIEGYVVELTHAEPPALAGKTIAPEAYALTFRVTRPTTTPTPVPNTVPAMLDQPVTLKMFQTLGLQGSALRVTLNGILQESRCPRAVSCAQAGRALVSFMAEQGERIGYFALSTSPPDGRTRGFFQGYAVELVRVEPYPETLDQKITPFDYTVTLVIHQASPPAVVNKNEGFPLRAGQSVTIAGENVAVKFVRVAGDSRCPYMVTCAVRGNAAVEATLEFADGTTQSYVLNTDDSKPNQRIPDTGDYGMELVALTPYPRADSASKSIAPEDYEATFVVRRFASPQGRTPTPTPPPPTACAGLNQADAEAILGQAAGPQTVPDVLIKIPVDNESFAGAQGLCGYLSTAKNTRGTLNRNDPYELAHASHAAVTAARLSGIKALELVRIAAILRFANPRADETPYLLFKTRLAAGDWDGLFATLEQVAQGAPDVHLETVDSFGDEGLWLWRAATDSNYAALLIRDKDTFVVVEALLDSKVSESAAREAIHAAMEKVME